MLRFIVTRYKLLYTSHWLKTYFNFLTIHLITLRWHLLHFSSRFISLLSFSQILQPLPPTFFWLLIHESSFFVFHRSSFHVCYTFFQWFFPWLFYCSPRIPHLSISLLFTCHFIRTILVWQVWLQAYRVFVYHCRKLYFETPYLRTALLQCSQRCWHREGRRGRGDRQPARIG